MAIIWKHSYRFIFFIYICLLSPSHSKQSGLVCFPLLWKFALGTIVRIRILIWEHDEKCCTQTCTLERKMFMYTSVLYSNSCLHLLTFKPEKQQVVSMLPLGVVYSSVLCFYTNSSKFESHVVSHTTKQPCTALHVPPPDRSCRECETRQGNNAGT